jgi:hypothetical protein
MVIASLNNKIEKLIARDKHHKKCKSAYRKLSKLKHYV